MNNVPIFTQRVGMLSKITMFLLSVFPITSYYITVEGFSNGHLLFLLVTILSIIAGMSIKTMNYPKYYCFFWGYVAIALILTSGLSITHLVPGGINFFLFSLFLGLCSYNYNQRYLYRYLKLVFIFSSIIFLGQELMYIMTGSRIAIVLPLGSHLSYENLTLSELKLIQESRGRSSSIFCESAYFAIYSLIVLAVEMYIAKKDVFLSKFAIFTILIIILSKSGCGFVGLAFLLIMKMLFFFRKTKGKKKMYFILCTIPVLALLSYFYLTSEMGADMISRSTELSGDVSDASGFVRVIRGFLIFERLPFYNKLLGVSMEELPKLSSLVVGGVGDYVYLNGAQTLLIQNGLVGLILFICVLVKIYRKGNQLSKILVSLLVLLCLIEQVYLMAPMLLCLTIANNNRKNEDSIFIPNSSF